jgi:hypothetical protein
MPATNHRLASLLRDFVKLCHTPWEDPQRWRSLAPFVAVRLANALNLPAGQIRDIGDEQFPCWLTYHGNDGSRFDLGGPNMDGTADLDPAFVVYPGSSVNLPDGHHARTFGVLIPYEFLAPNLGRARTAGRLLRRPVLRCPL